MPDPWHTLSGDDLRISRAVRISAGNMFLSMKVYLEGEAALNIAEGAAAGGKVWLVQIQTILSHFTDQSQNMLNCSVINPLFRV